MQPEATTSTGLSDSDSFARRNTSCAECRRSKLKCDRLVPCSSCKKRGCANLCPHGTLVAVKGNQALAAQSKKLAEQVKQMSLRIRNLEIELEAARALQVSRVYERVSRSSTPLENVSQVVAPGMRSTSAAGTLIFGNDGQVRYHGETAGSEHLASCLVEQHGSDPQKPRGHRDLGLASSIIELSRTFPFGDRRSTEVCDKEDFAQYIPPQEQAIHLFSQYADECGWMFRPMVCSDAEALIHDVYNEIPGGPLGNVDLHRLSLFFTLLALGARAQANTSSPDAERYYTLACATFALDRQLLRPSLQSARTLFFMVLYEWFFESADVERPWMLLGLCVSACQNLRLEREPAWSSNMNEAEAEPRRRMLWELLTLATVTSIHVGRPSALTIHNIDAHFPEDPKTVEDADGHADFGFHAWKFRYAASCLSRVTDHVLGPPSAYAELLDVDKEIRRYPVPEQLQVPTQDRDPSCSWSITPQCALQQYWVMFYKESTLLYIHRSYAGRALKHCPHNPLLHEYAPSVLVLYRSASRLITTVCDLHSIHPGAIRSVSLFWSGIFSACISLGSLVVGSPSCALAESALATLEKGYLLYQESGQGSTHPSTLAALHKLLPRARRAFDSIRGVAVAHDIAVTPETSLYLQDNLGLPADELQVMGGFGGVLRLRVDELQSVLEPPFADVSLQDADIAIPDGSQQLGPGWQGDLQMSHHQYMPPVNTWFDDIFSIPAQPPIINHSW
ncbi:hypothetical protein PUNSTDRAFT_127522 [Punctularia strigosozonata HHB-11173 SS5]|uniref:uncharacterized protein n=1 Tax=Punctularia strigosozonata (strain HHB-11173) TaxID=741275 RepID=UPI00044185E1|nr:uncharacterized protein PUNSTDRAFT_127522 [Punctularia strigosozonata HHB-11173 SS5]EIN06080.1 hypothetical protein PUNSTDRAFT_127522 [Punctularia strigosozonata HHB-11173 SS5]